MLYNVLKNDAFHFFITYNKIELHNGGNNCQHIIPTLMYHVQNQKPKDCTSTLYESGKAIAWDHT